MKSILLIGVNHMGALIAGRLQNLGHEVMAVDRDEERINEIQSVVTDAQIGDTTSESFLRMLGINNYDVCIVTIADNFEGSLVTTLLLKKLGASRVIARANSEIQEVLLLRNGADEVISPEKLAADWVADRYGR